MANYPSKFTYNPEWPSLESHLRDVFNHEHEMGRPVDSALDDLIALLTQRDHELEDYLANLPTASSVGGASSPFDGIVDNSRTPNHAAGIYETPFAALNDLGNVKKVLSPSIAVIDRQGGGGYIETASVPFAAGSTLFTGVTIKFFLAQEINGLGVWDTQGLTCDLGGGALQIEDGDITSSVHYDSTHAPFIRAGSLYMVRVRTDEFLHHIGINTTSDINQIFIDCNTFCTFHQGDGYVQYFGGRWDLSNITGFIGTTVSPAGPFSMIGTRITSTQPGSVRFDNRGVPSIRRFSFRGCEYISPNESSTGVDDVTFIFNTAGGFVDIDITGGDTATGRIGVTINDTTLTNLRMRGGPFVSLSMAAGSQLTANLDIDCYITLPSTIRGQTGTVKFTSINGSHTIIGLQGGKVDVGIRDGGLTATTMLIFQSVVQCDIDVGYFTIGAGTGNTPYNFDTASNRNILDFAGASQCPNAGVNAGVGNLIRTT